MLDCTYVLSARWADRCEVVASGQVVGADGAELLSVLLDRHHEDICAVDGDADGDACWCVEQWGNADDVECVWRKAPIGWVLEAAIPCRTVCPDQREMPAPDVELRAVLVPWAPSAGRKAPSTVIGAFVAQFRRRPRHGWHPSFGPKPATPAARQRSLRNCREMRCLPCLSAGRSR